MPQRYPKYEDVTRALLVLIYKISDSSLPYSQFLYIAQELSLNNETLDNSQDESINWIS